MTAILDITPGTTYLPQFTSHILPYLCPPRPYLQGKLIYFATQKTTDSVLKYSSFFNSTLDIPHIPHYIIPHREEYLLHSAWETYCGAPCLPFLWIFISFSRSESISKNLLELNKAKKVQQHWHGVSFALRLQLTRNKCCSVLGKKTNQNNKKKKTNNLLHKVPVCVFGTADAI